MKAKHFACLVLAASAIAIGGGYQTANAWDQNHPTFVAVPNWPKPLPSPVSGGVAHPWCKEKGPGTVSTFMTMSTRLTEGGKLAQLRLAVLFKETSWAQSTETTPPLQPYPLRRCWF